MALLTAHLVSFCGDTYYIIHHIHNASLHLKPPCPALLRDLFLIAGDNELNLFFLVHEAANAEPFYMQSLKIGPNGPELI